MSVEKIQNWLASLISTIANSWITKGIIIIGLIILAAFLIYTGIDLITTSLAILAIILSIFLNGLREIIGSIVISAILNISMIKADLIALINIWTNNQKIAATINYLSDIGFIKCAFTLFFITYTLAFLSGSIKLLNVNNSNSNKNKDLIRG